MKILFLGRHYTYFRNFESVVRELASRGHRIHLTVERGGDPLGTRGLALVESLAAEYPGITHGEAPGRADDRSTWTAGRLRLGVDYLRYLHPLYDNSPLLIERARDRTPAAVVALAHGVRAAGEWSRRAVSALVDKVERAVPDDPAIRAFIEEQDPDLVLITPLLSLGSSQVDYLRAARALGIPTALCVWSWDHLSSKAVIRDCPDRVFVWNNTQRQEAIELHDVPADRVVVTGAQCFDQWFNRAPSRSREEFCRHVGLPVDRPYILWVCSTMVYGDPPEAPSVVEWVRRVRASASPRFRDRAILIRPHPSRLSEWDDIDLRDLNVVVYGGNPVDAQSKADYFDSLYYSEVVVGINTSAFIEAGIVGRPVLAIVVPEIAGSQWGTVHFHYLVNVGGGLLTVAHGFDDHLPQLDAALANPQHGVKPFVREFVRPHGLERPATAIFVDEVEAMSGMQAAPVRPDPLHVVWARLGEWISRTRDSERFERWVLSSRELESALRLRHAHETKAIQRAAKRAAKDAARLQALQERQALLDERQRQRDARMTEWRRQRKEREAQARTPSS